MQRVDGKYQVEWTVVGYSPGVDLAEPDTRIRSNPLRRQSERDRIWVIADQLCCWPSKHHHVEVNTAAAAQFGYSKRLALQEIGQLRNRSESAGQISRRQRGEPRLLVSEGGPIGVGVTGAVVPPGLNEPLR
jgi:hypothetical protein